MESSVTVGNGVDERKSEAAPLVAEDGTADLDIPSTESHAEEDLVTVNLPEKQTHPLVQSGDELEEAAYRADLDSNGAERPRGRVTIPVTPRKRRLRAKVKDITELMIQYLVVNQEILINPLPEQIRAFVDTAQFFGETSAEDVLNKYPLLRMLHSKLVPDTVAPSAFWERFIYFVNRAVARMEANKAATEELAVANGPHEEEEEEKTISPTRYIGMSVMSCIKVLLVIVVLYDYAAPWYFYLYPALWIIIACMLVLRIAQIWRYNRKVRKAQMDAAREIEMEEMQPPAV